MTPQRYYRPELDVLRLLAFLSVFFVHRMEMAPIDRTQHYWFYHISWVGVFGVPVFFLLSAFLITELLTREQEQTGEVHPRSFYVRRMLRIWPLYFGALAGLIVLGSVAPVFGQFPAKAILPYIFFAGNWYICVNGWSVTYPTGPFWSISVEEQFYILVPLIMAYGGRRTMKIIAFAFMAIAYLFIIYYGMHPTKDFSSEWTNSFVQFQFFAAGILLSLYLKGRQPRWPLLMRVLMLPASIGCWLIANMVFHVQADAPHLSTVYEAVSGWLLVLLGCVLLLLGLLGTPAKWLPRPLVYLGRISYGLYIFHALMLWLVFHVCKNELKQLSSILPLEDGWKITGSILVFIFTVIMAMLSYRFFEKPFLRLKKRFTFVPSRD